MKTFVTAMTEIKVNAFGSSLKEEVATLRADLAARFLNVPVKHDITINMGETHQVEGILHDKFEDVLKLVHANECVYLYGPAGSGKNVIAEQVATAMGLQFYSASTLLQKYELLGYGDANGKFIETSFYKAFVNGGIFFLDEFDGCSPEVAIALNGALANGYLDFPVVGFKRAHNDFRCIAAGNTTGRGANETYNGRFQLDAATLDRFCGIEVDYDRRIELNCAEGDEELVKFAHEIRSAAENKGISIVCGYRAIKRLKKLEKLGFNKAEALECGLFKGLDKEDRNMLLENITNYAYKNAYNK